MENSGNIYFYNGTVLTMDPNNPESDHLLVIGGKVVNADSNKAVFGLNYKSPEFAELRSNFSDEIQFVDLNGASIIPGLTDAHCHFLWWGQNLILADLSQAKSEEDCIEYLKNYATDKKPGEWIVGFGWAQNQWHNTDLPTKKLLDEVFPNNPVLLHSKCFHLDWANSAAIKAAGITEETPDPDGGEIEKAADGSLTGIFKETALTLFEKAIPPANDYDREKALDRAQKLAHSYGITTVQEPDDLECWAYLQKAHNKKTLTMRVHFWIPVSTLDSLEQLRIQNNLGDDQLRITAVKMFSDGSLGGRTALMHDPYENEPDNYGIAVHTREEILDATIRANRAGLSIAIHAIGDKAVENVLSAYETAREEFSNDDNPQTNPCLRNRIEHLQVFADRDYDRLSKLAPISSMQPVHLCGDKAPADKFWGKRAKNAYAFKTLKDAGLLLTFGSDAPVETINPFHGMFAALTRQVIDDPNDSAWYPNEILSIEEILEAYTINCAIASGVDDKFGSLQAGKIADLVIIPADLRTLSAEEIRDIKPLATYIGGECVYRSN